MRGIHFHLITDAEITVRHWHYSLPSLWECVPSHIILISYCSWKRWTPCISSFRRDLRERGTFFQRIDIAISRNSIWEQHFFLFPKVPKGAAILRKNPWWSLNSKLGGQRSLDPRRSTTALHSLYSLCQTDPVTDVRGKCWSFKLFKLPAHATLATLATLWFFDLPGSETVFVGCHSHTTQCTWGLAESAVYISPSTGSLPFLPNNTFWEKCRAARCFDSFCVEKSLFSSRKSTRSYMVLDWFWDRCKLFLQENTMGHQVSFEPDLFLIFASQKLSHSET